jgi:hypothetical protein
VLQVLQLLGVAGTGREKEAVLGGASFFNASVERLIEGMEGADKLKSYTCLEQRGAGHEAPIARRSKSAADSAAALAELKEKLERQWRKVSRQYRINTLSCRVVGQERCNVVHSE